jgi:DNA-binding NarL/FixJ family response regulator
MPAPPYRVLIAEDNDDLRSLLVTLISAEPDLHCVATASDADTVRAGIADHAVDVQGRSSVDLLKALRQEGSQITIVIFSGHSHPEMVRHTLAAGADAYVSKGGDYQALFDAMRAGRTAA